MDFYAIYISRSSIDRSFQTTTTINNNDQQECYEERDDRSTNVCPSYGDLLAPSDEPAGANCTCSGEEEVILIVGNSIGE